MTIETFINKAVKKIQQKFPQSKLEYQFIEISETHFLKVTPQEVYEENHFLDLDVELTSDFDLLNTGETFCIVGEETLLDFKNPTIVVEPIYTDQFNFCLTENSPEETYSKFQISYTNLTNQDSEEMSDAYLSLAA